ncbi:GNAT family N-acetyltransferase [Polaromonas sp. C04]|mgnify:CR=1 FL=1|uniref:GNAT family N-acetyltransferase n=1 Tax=Polaromonas sp. C04 TaxID=1945857 RepID=UPI000986BA2E|nr:GNAT family N-acetyltransferase [Polaromonas sp. C04]OOG54868.1 hypothetical protein B0E49_09095 [Polaromonas sp. C04]
MDAAARYPVEWIDRLQLAGGDWVTLRPVLPQDDVQERAFVAHGLTSQSRYLRFQVGLSELPDALTQAFTHIDYHDHFALVAESFAGGQQTQLGDARFVRVGGAPEVAEFGIAVADAWHGLGIGRRLLCLLVAAARAQGVTQLYGDVLRGNAPMLALAQANGFAVQRHPGDARLVRVQRALVAPATPELIADCA